MKYHYRQVNLSHRDLNKELQFNPRNTNLNNFHLVLKFELLAIFLKKG